MERCMKMFKAGIKTKPTWDLYSRYLKQFKEWGKFETYTDIIKLKPKKLQRMIEDYVLELSETAHPNSIPKMWFGIQMFLEMKNLCSVVIQRYGKIDRK